MCGLCALGISRPMLNIWGDGLGSTYTVVTHLVWKSIIFLIQLYERQNTLLWYFTISII